ncbi:transmembrane and coiled-coil domain-containing protein 4 [Gaeumannomyces tritici R3-111a-1]|uniref:Transmembrane and coiled-coil domain-containing protein 4 n=1 Tax=Gaeumannomyces tritici (strain R3-111a-1) TaxID=644352 RepID=J3NSK9_GAET3|nr:transmembrane and coiled-coil domain-containing protein 4 [Gaeumannomyces tritici R3-111a-1]EJT79172.1 transmembrane and coiled-coil domain-containing protein 4 [Gaeumannomyces tritici R3-111a-1]
MVRPSTSSTHKLAQESKTGLGDAPHPGPSCSPTPAVRPPRLLPCHLPTRDTSPANLAKIPSTLSPSAGDASATDTPRSKDTAVGPDLPPSPPPPPEPAPEPEPDGLPSPMAPKSRPPVPRRPTDLTELLTLDQIKELFSLVVTITNMIRDEVDRGLAPTEDLLGNDLKWVGNEAMAIPPSYNMRGLEVDFGEGKTLPLADNSKSVHRATDDDSSIASYSTVVPAFESLRKDVLVAHRRWQTNILRRFSEVTIAKTPALKENAPPGSGTRGRAPRGGGRPAGNSIVQQPDVTEAGKPVHSGISAHILAIDEVRVVKGLSRMAQDMCPEEAPTTRKDDEIKYPRRHVGPTSVVINLPNALSAVGIGWVPDCGGVSSTTAAALLGSIVDSRIAVGTIFGLYGGRGVGKIAETYSKDVADFALLPLYTSAGAEFASVREVGPENRKLRVVMAVNGWLMEEDDAVKVWCALGSQAEAYSVRWDAEQLDRLGCALETVARSASWSEAKKVIADRRKQHHDFTPLNLLSDRAVTSIHEGHWPPSLLKVSKIVDHPWSSCMARADKAGATLAEAIMHRIHGERGITLIGYSLGARVIYTCLSILSERRILGLVENVVMMGVPAPADPVSWSNLRGAVAGRVINVYSEVDFMLAFLHRHSCTQFGIAGLQRIDKLAGVENVNASALITDHLRYHYLVGTILQELGFEDVDAVKVSEREVELRAVEDHLDYDKRCGRNATATIVVEEEPDTALQAVGASQMNVRAPSAPATRPRRSRGRSRNKNKK